jgi:hypothetical protein
VSGKRAHLLVSAAGLVGVLSVASHGTALPLPPWVELVLSSWAHTADAQSLSPQDTTWLAGSWAVGPLGSWAVGPTADAQSLSPHTRRLAIRPPPTCLLAPATDINPLQQTGNRPQQTATHLRARSSTSCLQTRDADLRRGYHPAAPVCCGWRTRGEDGSTAAATAASEGRAQGVDCGGDVCARGRLVGSKAEKAMRGGYPDERRVPFTFEDLLCCTLT